MAQKEAVAIERKYLQQLHKIDVAATALNQLVQDYAREKQNLESEIAIKQSAWEKEVAQMARERLELCARTSLVSAGLAVHAVQCLFSCRPTFQADGFG